jgi:phospholipid N-methyltransferase
VGDKARFLAEFVTSPGTVGAIAPSSPALARRMVDWIDWSSVRAVVEYGPGTGVFTSELIAVTRPGTKLLAVEINPQLAVKVRERYRTVSVHHASVADIEAICRREAIDQVDAIVCGLPWAAFSPAMQATFLQATKAVLRPGGAFATFAYLQGLLLPAGQRFRRLLRAEFSEVSVSPVIWQNLPPAFVYRCRL